MSGHKIILSLGSNIGNRVWQLNEAKNAIAHRIGNIQQRSKIYQTKAWGITDQPDFYNQIIILTSDLSPMETLNTCLEIEENLGRIRTPNNHWRERVIDIDILFIDATIIRLTKLTVPHPFILERNFILTPLNELNSKQIHPETQKTINFHLQNLKDHSGCLPTTYC